MTKGIATSLITKLEQAIADLSTSTSLACTDLRTLLIQIKAQSGKTLTLAQATQLTAMVKAAMAATPCP